jgi:CheY-specific phosphatase CheX
MSDELTDKIRKVFSDAAIVTFAKMTSVELTPAPVGASFGAPEYASSGAPDATQYDLSAVVGFSGDLVGSCALRLSAETAHAAINRLTGETIESPAELADGVGELVNMIAGNGKAALQGYAISLAFPEVIRGKGHEIGFSRNTSVADIYFTSEIGNVKVVVAFSVPKNVSR